MFRGNKKKSGFNLKVNMEQLKEYISLCWFKGDFDEMPESMSLFRNALIFYTVVAVFLQINAIGGFIEAFILVGFEIVLTFMFVSILLYFAKAMDQFWRVQTLYFICQDFILIFSVPLLIWVTITENAWAYYTLAIVVVWAIAVFAYINNQIINSGSFVSTMLSLAYFVTVYGGGFLLLLVFL